jgi:hypothetical protein
MTLLRLLNIQGIAGLVASIAFAGLLLIQKGETRHWRKQSGQFEQLYHDGQTALAETVANYRAAADAARAADRVAAERARAEQAAINRRSENAYEIRLADARARADRLRASTPIPASHSRHSGAALVPGLSAAPSGAAQTPGQDRLSPEDALTATEQAIQLDELIKWVRSQSAVDPNAGR